MTQFPVPTAHAIGALAPSGVLRAGINLSNILLVTGSDSDGRPVGVSPSLAQILADSLGVGLELISYPDPGDAADAGSHGAWDVVNIGADPTRSEYIDFSDAYSQIDATYLVRTSSGLRSVADVDREGIRVVSKARAAYTLWLDRNLERAQVVHTDSAGESLRRFLAEDIDALAGLVPQLRTDLASVPDGRMTEGWFTAVQQAIGTPRGRDASALAFLNSFVRSAVSSGLVADLIEEHGAAGLSVAREADGPA